MSRSWRSRLSAVRYVLTAGTWQLWHIFRAARREGPPGAPEVAGGVPYGVEGPVAPPSTTLLPYCPIFPVLQEIEGEFPTRSVSVQAGSGPVRVPPCHTFGGAPSMGRPRTPGLRCQGNGPPGGR